MASKLTRKTLKRKLDTLFSKIIRSKGVCERCGRKGNNVQLHTAHIRSRRFLVTRWDLNNALCLCAGCHRWGHDNPLEFADFIVKIKGKKKAEELIRISNTSVKKVDFEEVYEQLQSTWNNR